MITSDEGFRLIRSFEGYGRKLANGDCTAYQTRLSNGKLDIPTIGYGCTEGVRMGDVWTQDQADEALKREIAKHQAAVTQLVTVPLNQNENDACVSLSYNIGTGIGDPKKKRGFANSRVLKKLNAGDRAGAGAAFDLYIYAQGSKEKGLISRRTREKALFLKPVVQPAEPYMAQSVDPAKVQVSKTHVAAAAVTGTATIAQFMPAVPSVSDLDKMVQTGQHVRSLTDQAGDLSQWLWHSPVAPYALAVMLIGVMAVWLTGGTGGSSSKGGSSDSIPQ